MMDEERCSKTDLIRSACSHCRGLDDPPTPGAVVVGPVFLAQYPGRCPECDQTWFVGDPVGHLDNLLHCGSCHGLMVG
jgi:hypothetical protein